MPVSHIVYLVAGVFTIVVAMPANLFSWDYMSAPNSRAWAWICNWIAVGAFALAGVLWLFKA